MRATRAFIAEIAGSIAVIAVSLGLNDQNVAFVGLGAVILGVTGLVLFSVFGG
ncbi:hypothetical protein [Phycicoccus flavus]|uniref:Uncharacterized protein n=1 Tax=Phycicoccus flavus TaxID=2502783 RepID=A0A8T6R718_9MICO|nr:hypothetical protein [Phycicoccus flavus]NHA69250.1 hypothetical protein [Phycicoccus flavus]